MGKKKKNKRSQTGILQDHKRLGKKLVPPMAQIENLSFVRWHDDVLPDVLWQGLLLDRFGGKKGVQLAVNLAKVTNEVVKPDKAMAFALISEYKQVTVEQWGGIRHRLGTDDLYDLQIALWPLLSQYRRCYLRGILHDDWQPPTPTDPTADVTYLKRIVGELLDKRDKPATFVQATTVYLTAVTGKMKYASPVQVPDFNQVSDYPHTDASQRLGAQLRATINFLGALARDGNATEWLEYFWRHGYDISTCDITPQMQPAKAGKGVSLDELVDTLQEFPIQMRSLLLDSWRRVTPDLAHPTAGEVQAALMARQARLASSLVTSPNLWAYDLGRIILRCMVDTHITLAWLLKKGASHDYERFVEHGLGQEKLLLEHLNARLDENDPGTSLMKERLDGMQRWIDSQLATYFLPVNLGAWNDKNARDMAIEADCKDIYDLAYSPYSAVVHGAWNAIGRLNLTYCRNPLHKLHRIPTFEEPPLLLDTPLEAIKILDSTFRHWEQACKIAPATETPGEQLSRTIRTLLG